MDEAKRQFELVPAMALVDIQQYSSPVLSPWRRSGWPPTLSSPTG